MSFLGIDYQRTGLEIREADSTTSEKTRCVNCGSGAVEFRSKRRIQTAEGTPVIAHSFECPICSWSFSVYDGRAAEAVHAA
jgi:hypothetical protein